MIKVLLVEDEEIIRQLLRYTVDWLSMGCSVVGEASCGEDGLALVDSLRPDLIVTDIRMPGMSGIEMLERAQSRCEFRSILLTGYSEFEYAKKALSLGAVDYILKPIDERLLCRAVRRAVDQLLHRREYLSLKQQGAALPQPEELDQLMAACGDYYVKKVLAYMREHYRERLSLEGMADRLAISQGYLSKRFKAETSMTFGAALQKYRVQKAVALLKSRRMKVYEVAEAVGYQNYKRFCEVFRQVTHMSPTEFAASVGQYEQNTREEC